MSIIFVFSNASFNDLSAILTDKEDLYAINPDV
jgi:hypothetical protein